MSDSKQTGGGIVDQDTIDRKNTGPKSAGQGNVSQGNTSQENAAHFLQKVTDSLDQSVDAMDGITQARLQTARREALAESAQRKNPGWLMPTGSLAAAATVAVLTVSLWKTPEENADNQMPPLEDIALLSDKEELEFYQDLDFYLWLDDENKAS